jgi:membrane-associated phospholipid phosphatase
MGALRIGQFVAMYYKDQFQRPRPSQLWPELLPPIEVPGHASYPSGHGTEAYLVAACLDRIAGAVGGGTNLVPSADGSGAGVTTRLAQRIARNREVMGLHYPSDSAAGIKIAADLISTITSTPTAFPKMINLLRQARTEWKQFD